MLENKIEQISEENSEILLQDVIDNFYLETDQEITSSLISQNSEIKNLILRLIDNASVYQSKSKLLQSINDQAKIDLNIQRLKLQKDLIYQDFFKLQNLMNAYIGQKIIITYVQTDPVTGARQIVLMNNDVSHIQPVSYTSEWGLNYQKLAYQVSEHYQILKNSLSDEENQGLQNTAREVEVRYERYKGKILWNLNNQWYGYKLINRGSINEAYVNFYIHEIQLNNSLNQNINDFMTSSSYGAIQADNANGFFIGDTSIGGLQFAVKGAGGGPQGWTTIINSLKQIVAEGFSEEAFNKFINQFKELEKQKATSLIKPLSKKSISSMIRYHGNALIDSVIKNK